MFTGMSDRDLRDDLIHDTPGMTWRSMWLGLLGALCVGAVPYLTLLLR